MTEATKYWNNQPKLVCTPVVPAETAGLSSSTAIERRNPVRDGRTASAHDLNRPEYIKKISRHIRPVTRPRVLALANQKGGVGKTTTAINLGTALAAIGERVLIVDLDPQGNASTGLGIDRRSRNCSTYDVLVGAAPMRDSVVPTAVPRLHIATSTMDLSGLELELGKTPGRAFRLRDAIAALNT